MQLVVGCTYVYIFCRFSNKIFLSHQIETATVHILVLTRFTVSLEAIISTTSVIQPQDHCLDAHTRSCTRSLLRSHTHTSPNTPTHPHTPTHTY